jgi:hypothetical protein
MEGHKYMNIYLFVLFSDMVLFMKVMKKKS